MRIIKNLIGDILGYNRCNCGKSWWYTNCRDGYKQEDGSYKLICNSCYNIHKKSIMSHNNLMSKKGLKKRISED